LLSITRKKTMTETCKTVKVAAPVTEENPNGYVVKNEEDVAEGDVLFTEETEPAHAVDEFDAMAREDLKAYLVSKGVEFAGNTGDTKLRALCRAVPQ
jgi:hypothetical protein